MSIISAYINACQNLIRSLDNADGTQDLRRAYSSDEYLKITEEQLKAVAAQQEEQAQTPPPKEANIEQQVQPPPG